MKLLAILIAFGVFHSLRKPAALQSFSWWHIWLSLGSRMNWLKPRALRQALLLLIPVLLVGWMAYLLNTWHDHQLWYLLFNCVVLYYCLGPEQLEITAAEISAEDGPSEESPDSSASLQWLVNTLTNEAISRWFLVVFWFVVLGAAGALLSRLLDEMLSQQTNQDSWLNRGRELLSYPVIWLMILSLLVASDFDRIWRHCKRYLKQQNWYQQHRALLYEAMDFAVENCEIDDYQSDDFNTVRRTTLSVLKRMLMVWLVLVAFSVIFTIG